ncbi:hypothetical protein AB1N83_012189 [Pleurotus pulmonarius]
MNWLLVDGEEWSERVLHDELYEAGTMHEEEYITNWMQGLGPANGLRRSGQAAEETQQEEGQQARSQMAHSTSATRFCQCGPTSVTTAPETGGRLRRSFVVFIHLVPGFVSISDATTYVAQSTPVIHSRARCEETACAMRYRPAQYEGVAWILLLRPGWISIVVNEDESSNPSRCISLVAIWRSRSRTVFPSPMSDNSSAPTTQLITRTHRVPLSDCKTIVDFFKGMYDILQAHRWAVTEHKFLHHDISHSNIIVEVQDTRNIQEFSNTKRPVFINEVLHGNPAPPIARLLDMDNGANLDTSKVKPRRGTASDEPLRNHTCTSKMRGKRGSNSIEGQTQSAPKRLRKTGNNEERAPKDTSG